MNNFNDGAPRKPKDWIALGRNLVPLHEGVPIIKDWQNPELKLKLSNFKNVFQYGLRLDQDTDFDIDNHYIKRFAGKYLKSSGAVFGRKSNLSSHYLFSGSREYKKFTVPKELEPRFKHFEHGNTLCEIRSGHTHYTIVPDSVSMRSGTEYVEWELFSGIKEYAGNLESDISKIALSAALSILYAPEGARDDYCTAIAGVLSNHTNSSADDINEFVFNLAVLSGDHEPNKRMSKGTNAKNSKGNKFGMPKLAEIVGCSVQTIAKLFSWVGVKDSGSLFTELRCYTTEPKYWQLKYKDTWITIMDSSILLSYTKMSILILENCYEVAPVITPKQWKEIVAGLLKHVKKIDAPIESSYMGVVGGVFIDWLQTHAPDKFSKDDGDIRFRLGDYSSCARYDGFYWFKLEGITNQLKRKSMSFEMRKLTHFLREEFGAEPTKITIDKKELRVWKLPVANVDGHIRNNKDMDGFSKKAMERLDKKEEESGHRYKPEIPY